MYTHALREKMVPVAALRYFAMPSKGTCRKMQQIAQDVSSAEGSWIHAYLHRKEGDDGNAAYWYRRAGKPVPRISLEEEWREIVNALLV